eukprot:Nk52_evm1s1500 gene=Nk52_evmTU1s1500
MSGFDLETLWRDKKYLVVGVGVILLGLILVVIFHSKAGGTPSWPEALKGLKSPATCQKRGPTHTQMLLGLDTPLQYCGHRTERSLGRARHVMSFYDYRPLDSAAGLQKENDRQLWSVILDRDYAHRDGCVEMPDILARCSDKSDSHDWWCAHSVTASGCEVNLGFCSEDDECVLKKASSHKQEILSFDNYNILVKNLPSEKEMKALAGHQEKEEEEEEEDDEQNGDTEKEDEEEEEKKGDAEQEDDDDDDYDGDEEEEEEGNEVEQKEGENMEEEKETNGNVLEEGVQEEEKETEVKEDDEKKVKKDEKSKNEMKEDKASGKEEEKAEKDKQATKSKADVAKRKNNVELKMKEGAAKDGVKTKSNAASIASKEGRPVPVEELDIILKETADQKNKEVETFL